MPANNVSHKSSLQSLSYNARFLVFSKVVEKSVRFVYLMVLARFLGPDMLGLYNYGLAWYLVFLPLVCWGLGELLSIHLGRKPANAEDVVGATLLIRLFTTIVFAICCSVIGLLSNVDPLARTVIILFVFGLIARSFAMWGRACFVAVELSQYSAWLEIGFRLVEVLCGLVYLASGGGIIGTCAIHSACWIVEAWVALSLVRNRLSFRKILVPWSFLRPYAIEAFPIAANIFLMLALLQSGFVVLKHLSTDAYALGFYSVAFQLVVNTVFISEAFGQAALPILSRANGRGSGEQIVFIEAMLKICSFCSAVLVMFVIVFATYVLPLLFGKEYLMASDALVICSFSTIAYYALPFANEVLRAGFEYVPATVNIGIALLANIVVSVFLVSELGEKAPAIGLVVGGWIALTLHLIVIHRRIGKIAWWCAVFKPILSVLFALIVTWNLKQFGIFGFAVGVLILGGCYAACRMFTTQEIGYFTKVIPLTKRS